MAGSGYREPPALVRRADGQILQLTPILYALLEHVDGRTSLQSLEKPVSDATGREITAEQLGLLVDQQLRPLGLLLRPDGSQPELKRADPLLRIRFRSTITDPSRTRRLTAPFAVLFSPFIAVPVLLVFAVVTWWVLIHKGLAAATHDAFTNPGLLLLVFVVTVASAGFHEFGHAAASTRGGAVPGRIGFGFYLIWPAFFTDVSDSYRLGRWGRLRTDLGGLYFNAILVVLAGGVWAATRVDAILLLVATQLVLMLRQLVPVLRFDGYHILADAVGVPDLFGRIGPILRSVVLWRKTEPEVGALKPWVRVVVAAWVMIVVPLLLALAALLVVAIPRIVGSAWQSLSARAAELSAAWTAGDVAVALAQAAGMVAVTVPLAAMAYLLVRLGRQCVAWVGRRLRGSLGQRILAVVVVGAVLAALAAAWWPDSSRYRPVEPDERGTILDAIPGHAPVRSAMDSRAEGTAVALWGEAWEIPSRKDPSLALILTPADDTTAPTWVFPFDQPVSPRPGDNQALAVNTEDGSVRYDVAFALVWAADDTVDNVNEARAYASCRDCTTVAIAFQVVLAAGDADVVVPQNLAAAVNYACIECATYALAHQLVFTVDGELSAETTRQLDALWRELAAFAAGIEGMPIDEIQRRLDRFHSELAELLLADPAVTPRDGATAIRTPAPTSPADSSPSPGQQGPRLDDGESTPSPAPSEPSLPTTPATEEPPETTATTSPPSTP
jgi:putative peptide zinc metalloprotease protein